MKRIYQDAILLLIGAYVGSLIRVPTFVSPWFYVSFGITSGLLAGGIVSNIIERRAAKHLRDRVEIKRSADGVVFTFKPD